MNSTAFLGLGSNLGDSPKELRNAINTLDAIRDFNVLKISSIYISGPVDKSAQPNFYNCVVKGESSLSSKLLLQACQTIEQQQGRKKTTHWGPRLIDIDLLLFDKQELNTPFLTLPHPQMLKRDFVLYPLLEIEPKAILPNGVLIETYLPTLERNIL